MFKNNKWIRVFSMMLILCFLNGCMSYNQVELSKDQPIPVEEKLIQVNSEKSVYYLYDVELTQDHLKGKITDKIPVNSNVHELGYLNTKKKYSKHNLVKIYLDSNMQILKPGKYDQEISISLTQIKQIDVYEVNVEGTIIYSILGSAFFIIAFILVLFMVNPIELELH